MRNILSFIPGTPIMGEEILQWARFQVRNKTSHATQGKHILCRFGNIKPNRIYKIHSSYEGTGCGIMVKKPLVIKK